MRTQQNARPSHSNKTFNPHFAPKTPVRPQSFRPASAPAAAVTATPLRAKPARATPQRFRVVKPYEGFRLNQVVYLYQGPTYGIEGPGEVPVTVTPHQGPFVGLTSDYLERVSG